MVMVIVHVYPVAEEDCWHFTDPDWFRYRLDGYLLVVVDVLGRHLEDEFGKFYFGILIKISFQKCF